MKNIELFELCRDLYVPCIPYSREQASIKRWGKEGKHLAIHIDGLVTVDYPDVKEEWIVIKDGQVSDTSVSNVNDVDIDIYLLLSHLRLKDYRLYFLSRKFAPQMVSGIDLL